MVEKILLDDNLKAIHPSYDSLKAVGYTSKGERLEFDCMDGELHCYNQDLVSLFIPEGACYVYCWNNLLTELNIPDGIEGLNCEDNLIKELDIPDNTAYLTCDRNVLGLDKIYWDCNIRLR